MPKAVAESVVEDAVPWQGLLSGEVRSPQAVHVVEEAV
jgi:hypothetical protein